MEIKTDYTSKSFEIAKHGFFISLRVSLIVLVHINGCAGDVHPLLITFRPR